MVFRISRSFRASGDSENLNFQFPARAFPFSDRDDDKFGDMSAGVGLTGDVGG